MRKGFLGSIAALAAGAGTAWAQQPLEPTAPAGVPIVAPGSAGAEPPAGGPPRFGGFKANAIPGNSGYAPAPDIMPPGNFGPPNDPLGLGPVGGFGPPPGPMYPVPGPYAQQSFQPAPPEARLGGLGGDPGYGNAPRWWVDGEYILWFTKTQNLSAPLLTSSAPADAGVVGAASTTVLVGNRDLDYGALNGMRLTFGFFGDADRRFGFQFQGFFTEHKPNDQKFGTISDLSGVPTFGRPFVDLDTGANSAVRLSGPNFGSATARVYSDFQAVGVEPIGVWNVYRTEPGTRRMWTFDFLAGYKFLQVRENLRISSYTAFDEFVSNPVFTSGPFGVITQQTPTVPATAPLGGVLVGGPAVAQVRDEFRATNRFNGAVFGFRSEGRSGMFTTSLTAKVAVGNMHERMEIMGSSTFVDTSLRSGNALGFGFNTAGGGRGGAVGGVLANPNNIGTYERDRFGIIPEIGGTVGIALTRGLTGYIGVNFIYFPDVIRVGGAVNPLVSSSAVPFSANYGTGGRRGPIYQFNETDLWLGGVSTGLMLRY